MVKTEQLQIRVTSQQKREIRAAAKRDGVEMSAWVLSKVFPDPRQAVNEIYEELRSAERSSIPLAALHDFLVQLSGHDWSGAIPAPPDDLTPYLKSYVAAMVEEAAVQKGVAPPIWTENIDPMSAPVFGATMESLRMHLLTASPPAFRRRNIFVDTTIGGRV